MSPEQPDAPSPSIIPTLRYRDAPAAIEWLCRAFGFEERLVVPAENGGITHAQLTYRHGMIMLGTTRDEDDGMVQPSEAGGNTRGVVVVVEDPDAHHARAVAAGAEIMMEVTDQHYGGRLYSCKDPEGHLWHFGSYDPWAQV